MNSRPAWSSNRQSAGQNRAAAEPQTSTLRFKCWTGGNSVHTKNIICNSHLLIFNRCLKVYFVMPLTDDFVLSNGQSTFIELRMLFAYKHDRIKSNSYGVNQIKHTMLLQSTWCWLALMIRQSVHILQLLSLFSWKKAWKSQMRMEWSLVLSEQILTTLIPRRIQWLCCYEYVDDDVTNK